MIEWALVALLASMIFVFGVWGSSNAGQLGSWQRAVRDVTQAGPYPLLWAWAGVEASLVMR
jgi:hypothetical protein